MYQNQFQKYDPKPLTDADPGPVVVSDDGPVMDKWACRAAFQRSIGKIFFHAGFEEYQPSALDAVTDIAGDFFYHLVRTAKEYKETPIVADENMDQVNQSVKAGANYSIEEAVLHSLNKTGLEVEGLETYATEDLDRLGAKLSVMNDRMKSHLAELLVGSSHVSWSLGFIH
jgi:transcriptional activator SPT7